MGTRSKSKKQRHLASVTPLPAQPENGTVALARKTATLIELGQPGGMALIATDPQGNTSWSMTGYDDKTATYLVLRFLFWQLFRLNKEDMMREAIAQSATQAPPPAPENKGA